MFVRTASERDLAAIRSLLVETWHATYDEIYGPARVTEITDECHCISALRARLTCPNSEFLVADDGKEIGGVAFAVAEDGGACVTPSVATATDRTYPIARPLYMYTVGEARGDVADYLRWILSDEGQCILVEIGYPTARPMTCA